MGKKKILVWMLAFVMMFQTFGMKSSAAGFQTEVREGVAVLATYCELDGVGEVLGWGTCFFVGAEGENPQYLITNHHVIEDYLNNGAGEWKAFTDGVNEYVGKLSLRVYFNENDYVEAYVEGYDAQQDIALLRTEKPVTKRKSLPIRTPDNSMIGMTVYAVGYPGLADNMYIDSVTSWDIDDVTVTTGSIGRLITTSGTGTIWLQTDVAMSQGNSGGPMVDENGAVVGVNQSAYRGDLANEYYAVNVNAVVSLLNSHGIQYVTWEEEEEFPWTLLIIIAACAVAAIILIIVIVVLAQGGKKKKAAAVQAQAAQAAAAAAAAAQEPPKPEIRPSVRSLAPQHNGMRVALAGRQITIGRDPGTCAIVFREGTPGVSGRHCSLTWDSAAGDFVLTDLKSSYGTFLMSGQRLAPGAGYHLRAGDSFYLGEKGNVLRVELE